MTNEEKYYRRTYNLLNDLIYAYRKGYNKQEILQFYQKCLFESMDNYTLFNEKRQGLLLTIIIALLGVNKESIERAEVFDDYSTSIVSLDFRKVPMDATSTEKISQFESEKTKNSLFDNWLSIKNSPNSDTSNKDIFRRVRNGLLHSNFYIDTKSDNISITHIKTKSYYESVLLNQNFFQFIISYFSNVPTVGICEKTIIPYINYNGKIKNKAELKKYLSSIIMVKITYSMDNYNGYNSLDNKIAEILKERYSKRKILSELNNASNNSINIKNIDNFSIADSTIESIINYFEKKYGNTFYKLSEKEKMSLINSYVEYIFENKRQIGNWLLHFYHLINYSIDPNFKIDNNFFLNDEYAVESLEPTLVILKGYLIMYRLENKNFDDINYEDVIFDFEDNGFYCWSEKNNEITTEDYYLESFNKAKNKNPLLSDDNIKKIIICEIIRNGLAHGHLKCFTSEKSGEKIIEIKDIHKNHSRCIQMTIDKFEKFLSSPAFMPKNCFNLENNNKRRQ